MVEHVVTVDPEPNLFDVEVPWLLSHYLVLLCEGLVRLPANREFLAHIILLMVKIENILPKYGITLRLHDLVVDLQVLALVLNVKLLLLSAKVWRVVLMLLSLDRSEIAIINVECRTVLHNNHW